MSEVYYHNGPSRAWRSELIRERPCANFYGRGGRIQLYAAPLQTLPPNLGVMAYIFTLRLAVLPVTYSIVYGGLFGGDILTEDGNRIITESGNRIVTEGLLTLDPVTGVISGHTPDAGATAEAIFKVVDAEGRIGVSEIITFVVSESAIAELSTEDGIPIGTQGGQPLEVQI